MSLFVNKPKVVALICVFIALIIGAFATECRSADLHLNVGATVVRDTAPVLGFEVGWPKSGILDTSFAISLDLWGESNGDRNNAALAAAIVDGFGKLDIGIGLGVVHHTDSINGSYVNFHLLLGYRFTERFKVRWRHFSNAGMTDGNVGRDMVIASWRF